MHAKGKANIKIQPSIQAENFPHVDYALDYNFYYPYYYPTQQEIIKQSYYYYKSMFLQYCTAEIGVQTVDFCSNPQEVQLKIASKQIEPKIKKKENIIRFNEKTLEDSLKELNPQKDSDNYEGINEEIISQNGCFNNQQIKKLKEYMIKMLENQNQFQLAKAMILIEKEQNSLICQILKQFFEKIKRFKKSKQELLKIIIRKIQKFHKSKPSTKRNRKNSIYGGFKSMNVSFLKKIFSDQDFVSSFKLKATTFKEDFKQENKRKLDNFIQELTKIKNQKDVEDVLEILSEKNKMPWPHQWSEKLNKTLIQIYWKYIVKDQNFIIDLKKEFVQDK